MLQLEITHILRKYRSALEGNLVNFNSSTSGFIKDLATIMITFRTHLQGWKRYFVKSNYDIILIYCIIQWRLFINMIECVPFQRNSLNVISIETIETLLIYFNVSLAVTLLVEEHQFCIFFKIHTILSSNA